MTEKKVNKEVAVESGRRLRRGKDGGQDSRRQTCGIHKKRMLILIIVVLIVIVLIIILIVVIIRSHAKTEILNIKAV